MNLSFPLPLLLPMDPLANRQKVPMSQKPHFFPSGFTREFNKKNIDMAVKVVGRWEELGESLNLPSYKMKEIAMDMAHKGLVRQRSEMIDLWLRFDVNASWKTLCTALEQMDENKLAHEIRTVVEQN